MRGAVIDLGSCTFHALIADVDEYGIRKVVFERKRAVRIAEDFSRATDAIEDLMERVRARLPEPCRVIATGVFRERAEYRELVERTCDRYVFDGEIVDGEEEARLAWVGVSSELAGSHRSLAVVDLGGGSLQLAAGETELETRSLPLGVLQLRHLPAAEIRERVLALAGPVVAELAPPDTIALASGTARTLLGLGRHLGLISDVQHHVGTRTFRELARMLVPLSADGLAVLGVPSSRRDTIAAGAVALAALLDLLGKPVVYVARSAMREGALVDLARRERSTNRHAAAIGRTLVPRTTAVCRPT